MRPELLPRDSVIRLRKINEGNMQSRTVPGLQLFSSMPKMPQNKQRVQSASARKEAKGETDLLI